MPRIKHAKSSMPRCLLLFLMIGLNAVSANACECVPAPANTQTLAKKLQTSSAVFVGRVVAVKEDTERRQLWRIEFAVQENFKAAQHKRFISFTEKSSAACGANAILGKTYLVFAWTMNEQIRIDSCGSLIEIDHAATELSLLRHMRQRK